MVQAQSLRRGLLFCLMAFVLHARVQGAEVCIGLSEQEELLVVDLFDHVRFAYVPHNVCELLVALYDANGMQDEMMTELCADFKKGMHIAPYEQMISMVMDMAEVLDKHRSVIAPADYTMMSGLLAEYTRCLENGDALLKLEDEPITRGCKKRKKCKVVGTLLVQCTLTAGSLAVLGNAAISGNLTVGGTLFGPNGPISADLSARIFSYTPVAIGASTPVASDAPVIFTNNVAASNITNNGAGSFTLGIAGVYHVFYRVAILAIAGAFYLTLDNVFIPGSVSKAQPGGVLEGEAMFVATAGQVVQLRNASVAPISIGINAPPTFIADLAGNLDSVAIIIERIGS